MAFRLTPGDQAMLNGDAGPAAASAMAVLRAFGEALGAGGLLDVARVHIDGRAFHGQVSLDFAERLAAGAGRVAVPTTLNVGSLDLLHPDRVHLLPGAEAPARRLLEAHVALGCVPSFACTSYQPRFRPRFGEQIVWGDSSAVVFANSAIGARTNRYGGFVDLCCALTGRAPAWGLHLDENRRGRILFRLTGFPASQDPGDALFAAVGLLVGARSGEQVPVIEGLPMPCGEDRLQALGAAAASAGPVALFHAVGLTPEAPTLADALGGRPPRAVIAITPEDVATALVRLSSVPDGAPLGAVCLGVPHFSLAEWQRLIPLVRGLAPRCAVPIYVHTGRAALAALQATGALADLAGFGVIPVAEARAPLAALLDRIDGVVMTESGGWTHPARGNGGAQVAFGSLEDCIASAAAGRVVRGAA